MSAESRGPLDHRRRAWLQRLASLRAIVPACGSRPGTRPAARNPKPVNALRIDARRFSGRSHFHEGTMAKISRFMSRNNKAAARLDTPTDLGEEAVTAVSEALNGLLADSFALYL